MGSLYEKSGLDTGGCLENIETFITTAEVVMNHGLSRYVYNEDIIKLAENMLLSKELPSWEQFCSNRYPSRTEGIDSLSETVIQMANDLERDPSSSTATWGGSKDVLIADEDKDLENTKLSIVSRGNRDFINLLTVSGRNKLNY